jgi:hypothetical protein
MDLYLIARLEIRDVVFHLFLLYLVYNIHFFLLLSARPVCRCSNQNLQSVRLAQIFTNSNKNILLLRPFLASLSFLKPSITVYIKETCLLMHVLENGKSGIDN